MNQTHSIMNKINKIIIRSIFPVLLVLGGIFPVLESNAQQDSQFTQYMYNTQTINPAYVGSRGVLSFNGLYRTQWVGLDGAPETLNFSVNSPISDRVGLGASFYSDKIGPSTESNITIDFSYSLPLNENDTYLTFGLKGGMNILNVDYTLLNAEDPGAPDFANNIENRTSPGVGAGVYLRGKDKWYAGISVPNLLETDHYDDIAVSDVTEKMHFYVIGGYVFDMSESVKFKPAVLGKAVVGAPIAVDVSANFMFYDKLTLGAAYRWDAAVSGLAGFQFTDNIMLGYAYDYDTTELGNYNHGSHEFFIRFELGTKNQRTINPRFF